MDFRRHVPRILHEDHRATSSALERLSALLGRHHPTSPPLGAAPEIGRLLADLARLIDGEIAAHFAFEEDCVFPRLGAAGEHEMNAVLIDEHRTILPLAKRLAAQARRARSEGFAADSWAEFHAVAAELIARLAAHIEKEDMGLLPALDDLLDEEVDGALALELSARR